MTEKTASALYALLKELYQSPAAKEFVNEYEGEEREQRHEARAVPVNWSVEKDNAYNDLTEAIFKRKPLSTIQKAATTFVDICNREERRKPEASDVYRDILGNSYTVLNVVETFHDETGINKPFVALLDMSKGKILTPTLEEFMNPAFKKV